MERYVSRSPEQTQALAQRFFRQARSRGVRLFLLCGTLGSGKTVFVRGLAKALGVTRPVKSPSFVLVQELPARRRRLIHADLYRVQSLDELRQLDLRQYLEEPRTLLALEWADKLPSPLLFAYPACLIDFEHAKDKNRRLKVRWLKARIKNH